VKKVLSDVQYQVADVMQRDKSSVGPRKKISQSIVGEQQGQRMSNGRSNQYPFSCFPRETRAA